jgi:CheY-like chemotaxis protein
MCAKFLTNNAMLTPTVLNIDDSEDDAVMLKAACGSGKVAFKFQWVNSGESALLYLKGDDPYANRESFPFPTLILLDLKMPGTSGFDVLRSIRTHKNESIRRLPVVVFTSSMHDEDARCAFELGADAYLVKPSDFDELRAMIITIDSILARSELDLSPLRNLRDAKVRESYLTVSCSSGKSG